MRVHYVEHGHGRALVALHGAGVDHREIAGALEPVLAEVPGIRRIYPDLPGMGRTAAPARLGSNDDVVDVLLEFLDRVVGDERVLVAGHSLGGYLARAVAARRPGRVGGLALICPAGRASRDVPPHAVVRTQGDPAAVLDPGDVPGFEEYVVLRTPQTAQRYRDRVVPGTRLEDEAAVGRILGRWALRDEPGAGGPQAYPTVILAGRQDSSWGGPPRPTCCTCTRGPPWRWWTRPATRSRTSSRRSWRRSCATGWPSAGPMPRPLRMPTGEVPAPAS